MRNGTEADVKACTRAREKTTLKIYGECLNYSVSLWGVATQSQPA